MRTTRSMSGPCGIKFHLSFSLLNRYVRQVNFVVSVLKCSKDLQVWDHDATFQRKSTLVHQGVH